MVCRLRVVTIKLLKRDNPGLEAGTDLDGLGVDVEVGDEALGLCGLCGERVNLLVMLHSEIGLAMSKKGGNNLKQSD